MKNIVILAGLILVVSLLIDSGCQPQDKVVAAEATAAVAPSPVPAEMPAPAAPASAAEPSPTAPAVTGPQITFEQTEFDLGAVGPATKHTLIYKFKNTGRETLKITDVKAPCGCTIPVLEKKEYAPGESGQIEVTYTAVVSRMPVTKHVYVVSNDRTKPEFTLMLKAVSVPKVSVTPENMQLSLREENAGMPKITLQSTDGKAFSIKSFNAGGGSMTADFDPKEEATTFTLSPRVDMDKLRANLSGSILIELTHPGASQVEAHYTCKPDYETQPAIFYLQAAQPDKVERKELWVISNYDENFEIESVTSEKGSMTVAEQTKQGNKYHLAVDIRPPASAAATRFFLDNLIIKIKDGPTLKVRCNAWLKPMQPARASR